LCREWNWYNVTFRAEGKTVVDFHILSNRRATLTNNLWGPIAVETLWTHLC